MQYHEVKINLELSSFASMITTNALSGGQVSVSGGSIGYASLWCDYVYLDTDERRRFAQVSHEYLIEQLQYTGAESVSSTQNKLRLNFNHPCKELAGMPADELLGYISANFTAAAVQAQVNDVKAMATLAFSYWKTGSVPDIMTAVYVTIRSV